MELLLSESQAVIIATILVTVAAVALAIVYTRRKQRALALGSSGNSAQSQSQTAASQPSPGPRPSHAVTDCDGDAAIAGKQQSHPQSREKAEQKKTAAARTDGDLERSDEPIPESESHCDATNPEEMAKMLGEMGGCPLMRGLPRLSKVGGTWPPEQGDAAELEHKEKEERISDPKEFCDHIPGNVKRTQQRVAREKIEATMNEEEKQREQEVQRQQMEAIFKLMETEKDKFGMDSVDDIKTQMSLYVQ